MKGIYAKNKYWEQNFEWDFYLMLLLIPSAREERHLGISQKYQKQKQTVMIHDKFDPSPFIWCTAYNACLQMQ